MNRRWFEPLLALLVLAGGVASGVRLMREGRLPQPFVPDSWDTFMDWFNPAFWAHGSDVYPVWHSVYPPLSFVLLRLVSLPGCYAAGPFAARDCDGIGIVLIVAAYLACAGLAALAFRRHDRRTAPCRAMAFAGSLPLLFALERGNLILLCLPFFIAAVGGLAQRPWTRALCAAVALNFKPYLVVPIAGWAVERRWALLKLAGLLALGIYLATLLLFGSGNPAQLLYNSVGFARAATPLIWEQGLYTTSLAPLPAFADLLPADVTRPFVLIPFAVNATRLMLLACLVGAWWKRVPLSEPRVALLLLGAYLAGQSPGGYTYAFVLFLTFLERAERPGPAIAIAAAYLLCIPYDLVLGPSFANATWASQSWLTGAAVVNRFGMSVGMFARPLLLLVLLWALAIDIALLLRRAWSAGAQPDATPVPA